MPITEMPHLDDALRLDRSVDLELARKIRDVAKGGEHIVIRLLADHQPDDPHLRKAAYAWLFEQVAAELQLGELK